MAFTSNFPRRALAHRIDSFWPSTGLHEDMAPMDPANQEVGRGLIFRWNLFHLRAR